MTEFHITHSEADCTSPTIPAGVPAPRDGATVFERILGLIAVATLGWCCLTLEGFQTYWLLSPMPFAMVAAITLGGLIMSHGPRPIAKLIAVCFGAAATDDAEADALRSLCRRGRSLAYTGATLQAITGTMHVLSVLDNPGLIGPGLAVSLLGFVQAIVIAELGFGSAVHWVNTRSPLSTSGHH